MRRPWLSYAFTMSFAVVFVQALVFGYTTGGMSGALMASLAAYGILGFTVGFLWPQDLILQSIMAGIPPLLFILALYGWSLHTVLTSFIEGIPLVLEPLSASLSFGAGAWLGCKASAFRRQQNLPARQS